MLQLILVLIYTSITMNITAITDRPMLMANCRMIRLSSALKFWRITELRLAVTVTQTDAYTIPTLTGTDTENTIIFSLLHSGAPDEVMLSY